MAYLVDDVFRVGIMWKIEENYYDRLLIDIPIENIGKLITSMNKQERV